MLAELSVLSSGVQYAFHLKTEVAQKRDGSALVLEKLCLAFDELAEAEKWRQAIAQQVENSIDNYQSGGQLTSWSSILGMKIFQTIFFDIALSAVQSWDA